MFARLIIIIMLLTGCASQFTLPSDIRSAWIVSPNTSSGSKLVSNKDHEAWIISTLNKCKWSQSKHDYPQSNYQFELMESNNSIFLGQLLENEFIIGRVSGAGADDNKIFVCHTTASTANKFRAIYE